LLQVNDFITFPYLWVVVLPGKIAAFPKINMWKLKPIPVVPQIQLAASFLNNQ